MGAQVIDCTGLTIAPGFIDVHSHSDLQVLENRPEKALQGVTTEVVGNCGFSAVSRRGGPAAAARFRQRHLVRLGDWGWAGAAAISKPRGGARQGTGRNRSWATGRCGLRVAAARLRALCAGGLDAMERALDESLAAARAASRPA